MYENVLEAIGSRWVFALAVAAMAVSGVWVALTADYPIVYDERFHLSTIELFATNPMPWGDQPFPTADVGDQTRSGSVLFYWLFALPWLALDALGASQSATVWTLRLLNVAIATAVLFGIRRLGRELGAPEGITNLTSMIYALAPLTGFLAATINYDNLVNTLVVFATAIAVRILKPGSPRWRDLCIFIALAGAAAITKYTVLPFVGVLGLFVLVVWVRRRRSVGFAPAVEPGRAPLIAAVSCGLAALLVLAVAVERYIGNLVLYRTPFPACERVQSVAFCGEYGIWTRNTTADAAYPDDPLTVTGALDYAIQPWLPNLISWSHLQGVTGQFSHASAVPAALVTGAVAAILTVLIIGAPRLLRAPASVALTVSALAYISALFYENYSTFATMGIPYAIQGRYLLFLYPILLIGSLMIVSTLISTVSQHPRRTKVIWVALLALSMTQTAGVIQYARVANPTWIDPSAPLADLAQIAAAVARALVLSP